MSAGVVVQRELEVVVFTLKRGIRSGLRPQVVGGIHFEELGWWEYGPG